MTLDTPPRSVNKCSNCLKAVDTVICDFCNSKLCNTCSELNVTEFGMMKKTRRRLKYQCKTCPKNNSLDNPDNDKFTQIMQVITALQQQILNMQTKFEKLENVSKDNVNQSVQLDMETIMDEMEERKKRLKNVIMYEVPESGSSDTTSRINHDKEQANEILSSLEINNFHIVKTHRLGRAENGKVRPLLVVSNNEQEVRNVLKNARLKRKRNVKRDNTPMQRNQLKELNTKLKEKENNGKQGWTIKYIKGQPKLWKPMGAADNTKIKN